MVADRLEIVKKYGVLGVLVVSAPFIEPYVSKYFTEVATSKYTQVLREEIYTCSSRENKLQPAVILQVARYAVGKQSIHKVEAIRQILKQYDVKDTHNHYRIKIAIKNELYRQSKIYTQFLNQLAPHPRIGYIGTYIENSFDMSVFLDRIFQLVLKTDCSSDIVTQDVMNYMLEVQNNFFQQMEMDMKGK